MGLSPFVQRAFYSLHSLCNRPRGNSPSPSPHLPPSWSQSGHCCLTHLRYSLRVPVDKLGETRRAEGVVAWQQPRLAACVRFQTHAASHTAVYALVAPPCSHLDSARNDALKLESRGRGSCLPLVDENGPTVGLLSVSGKATFCFVSICGCCLFVFVLTARFLTVNGEINTNRKRERTLFFNGKDSIDT